MRSEQQRGSTIAMKTITCFIAALAVASTFLNPVLAQSSLADAGDDDVCHQMGSWASQAAVARNRGVPLSDVLDVVRGMANNPKLPPGGKTIIALYIERVERVVLAVYGSDMTPNNAYVRYRAECQKLMSGP